MGWVKTTIEVADALFRRAKSLAAERGIRLLALGAGSLSRKLLTANLDDKPWMKFPTLLDLITPNGRESRPNQPQSVLIRLPILGYPDALGQSEMEESAAFLVLIRSTRWRLARLMRDTGR